MVMIIKYCLLLIKKIESKFWDFQKKPLVLLHIWRWGGSKSRLLCDFYHFLMKKGATCFRHRFSSCFCAFLSSFWNKKRLKSMSLSEQKKISKILRGIPLWDRYQKHIKFSRLVYPWFSRYQGFWLSIISSKTLKTTKIWSFQKWRKSDPGYAELSWNRPRK